ncbi:MAG TPA: hypothetical protein VK909_07840 [Anaerolineales bacterium]|jgi:hypothetical protein|nr:hypothetical protein [Anaerolineales bacterium]
MCLKSEQAVDLYNKACRSEQEGQVNLAEVYYLKSWSLFEQAGGCNCLNAANTLNALAFLRWSRQDYVGALSVAKASKKIMETSGNIFPGADADLIRSTAWELVDQVSYELMLASGVVNQSH